MNTIGAMRDLGSIAIAVLGIVLLWYALMSVMGRSGKGRKKR